MENFESIKQDLIARAEKAGACRPAIYKASHARNINELLAIATTNAPFVAHNCILDAEIMQAIGLDVCAENGIFLNQDVDSGFCVVTGNATVRAGGGARVAAYGTAKVLASGSAVVFARDSVTVVASETALVEAVGIARAAAKDSARINASDFVTVTARGGVNVTAKGNASVTASGATKVYASGNSKITAQDTARIIAWESATVVAEGTSVVTASENAKVTAGKGTEVNAHGSARVWAHEGARVKADQNATVTRLPEEPPARKIAGIVSRALTKLMDFLCTSKNTRSVRDVVILNLGNYGWEVVEAKTMKTMAGDFHTYEDAEQWAAIRGHNIVDVDGREHPWI